MAKDDAFLKGYADSIATMILSLDSNLLKQLLVLEIIESPYREMRLTTKEMKLKSMLTEGVLEKNK
ncbi:MAG: hypothetical protein Q8O47_09875 [Candidatus Bathyarchaeota archaeon]|nr:hypothetical protein [Candidatus Bathyarchaeota archaeon]